MENTIVTPEKIEKQFLVKESVLAEIIKRISKLPWIDADPLIKLMANFQELKTPEPPI